MNPSPESIVKLFAEGLTLFQKWRKTKDGKKAVGGAELEASLTKGHELVEEKRTNLFKQYGMSFENGDPISRAAFSRTYTDMDNKLVGIFKAVLSGQKIPILPLDMHRISQLAQMEALRDMDALSRRLDHRASKTAPEDSLPPMPLLPRRRSYERKSPKPPPQPAQPAIPPKVPQNEMALVPRPKPAQNDREALSRPFGRGPSMEALPLNAMEKLQGLMRRVSSSSTLSSTSSIESRPSRYEPHESLIPAIEVSYIVKEESSVVIREGRESVDRLWAAANTPLRPQSVPLMQGEWTNETLGLEPPRYLRNRASASNISVSFSTTELHKEEPVFQTLASQPRKGPSLSFSAPPSRFKRHVSQP